MIQQATLTIWQLSFPVLEIFVLLKKSTDWLSQLFNSHELKARELFWTPVVCLIISTNDPWVEEIQFCLNEGPCPSPRGDNSEIVKLYWKYLKIFFFRITEPISTKLGTNDPWVEGIQFFSNEGPCPSPRGDNREIVKLYWKYF